MAGLQTASFIIMLIILLIVLSCLVILIIKLFVLNTGATGGTLAPVLTTSNATNAATKAFNAAGLLSLGPNNGAFYGNGSDGNAKYEGRTGLRLTKDAFYNNLTLNNSVLDANGYRLFVAGTLTLTNGSVIHNAGKDGGANNAFGAGPVPGGTGAASGTLGGGANGGSGYLKGGSAADMNGGSSSNVLWGANTTLFSGADATTSSAVAAYGVGQAGTVATHSLRSNFDAVQALNASYTPTAPLLSGGSGGGGGQGAAQWPGSGGGGGGGVVVIVAQNLVVPKGGATINVSGGNGGSLGAGGPFNATSGGGGGGGLILIATPSPPSSYEGLSYNVAGGLSVDSNGNSVQASPGRVVHWFNAAETDSNPNQFLTATSTVDQTLPNAAGSQAVSFANVANNVGISADADSAVFTVQQAGMYMVHADLPVNDFDSGTVEACVVKNGDPTAAVFGKKSVVSSGAQQTVAIFTVVPLQPKDTFEIQVTRDTGSVTVARNATLSAFLLTQT